eukprot:TRINITY_DN1235_c2_g2_i1.p1 TRINITY_DN1235_c2_g2~~TRINITY_DN1235_c2_g2_i1.p1  ORF type:complete len:437 (-),score=167.18 TRINITY_DN1235_c2_g2_i1:50-1360(-)
MINNLTIHRPNTILIDCTPGQGLVEHNPDFIQQLSLSVGFFPSFQWVMVMINWLESILPASKAFSPERGEQLLHILDTLSKASQNIDKAKITAHRPVIIFYDFHNLLSTIEQKGEVKMLAQVVFGWANKMASQNHAHVVFVTSDPFAGATTKRYVESRGGTVDVRMLDEYSSQATKLLNKITYDKKNLSFEEQLMIIKNVGGRLTDLLSLRSKIISGSSPIEAVEQIIQDTIATIRSEVFGNSTTAFWTEETSQQQKSQFAKTRAQSWITFRSVAEKKEIDYDQLVNRVYEGNEEPVHQLISSNILKIIINKKTGKIEKVTAFSPLYLAAFEQMIKDEQLSIGLDIMVKKWQIEKEMTKLKQYEDELVKLRSLVSQGYLGESEPQVIKERRKQLEGRFQTSITKLAELEEKLDQLTLSKEKPKNIKSNGILNKLWS